MVDQKSSKQKGFVCLLRLVPLIKAASLKIEIPRTGPSMHMYVLL